MAFEWNRIHKWEDNFEREITDEVRTRVEETYGCEVYELSAEQIKEVEQFRDELNEYSVMQVGFSNVLNEWDMENGTEI